MKKIIFTSASIATLLLSSCGNNSAPTVDTETNKQQDTAVAAKEEFTMFEFDKMMANFPKPLDMVNEIAKAGVKYDKASINNVDNEKNYVTESKRALNFGVYSVDLGYLSTYDKKQEVLKSFKTVRKLAESLNALESFDNVAGANFESKLSNKDTLVKIADDVYYESYNNIKSSNRLEIATLIVCGSWVESQNFALQGLSNYERNAKTEFLYNKIYEQKTHLDNLLSVMNQFKDKDDFAALITDFENLKSVYASFKDTKELTKATVGKLAEVVKSTREKVVK